MPEVFEASSENPNYILEDHSYGKGGVKLLHLVRNGIPVKLEQVVQTVIKTGFVQRSSS